MSEMLTPLQSNVMVCKKTNPPELQGESKSVLSAYLVTSANITPPGIFCVVQFSRK